MTKEKIQRLIDRFLDGDTTPREEQQLYDFFRQGAVPEELQHYTALFVKLGDTLRPVPAPAKPKPLIHRWAIAASIAVILGIAGWLMMGNMGKHVGEETESYAKAHNDTHSADNPHISVRTEPTDEETSVCPDVRLNQGDESPTFADNQNEHPLLAQTEPELQTEQPVTNFATKHSKLSVEYEQTSLSIRQRGERLMSQLMASNTTETDERYN